MTAKTTAKTAPRLKAAPRRSNVRPNVRPIVTLRRAARRLIVGVPGPELGAETRRTLRALQPFGVILFGWNVVGAEQLADLNATLRSLYRPRPLLFLDQEGGRVDRLRAVLPEIPSAARLGRAGAAAALRSGECAGAALSHFGFDVDFAPVCDMDLGGPLPGLARRLFGRRAETVIAGAGAFLAGLHRAGIGGCIKHFPGLGLCRTDTHEGRAMIDTPLEVMRERELLPFAALGPAAGAVMVGHGVYTKITGDTPASMSPRAIALLRRTLRFRGAIFSDDLNMQGASMPGDRHRSNLALPVERRGRGEVAAQSVLAGCDIVSICHSLPAIPAALETMVEKLERAGARGERALERAEARTAEYLEHLKQVRKNQQVRWTWDELRSEIESLREATGKFSDHHPA